MKSLSNPLIILLLAILTAACSGESNSSVENARKSPIAISAVQLGNTYVKVVYGQPHKRGREIFGTLVSYGEVWRTGANEATEITFTEDVEFGGNLVESGIYSLFTIPEENQWTVILNKNLGQWGAFSYDDTADYLRFNVPVQTIDEMVESFTINFSEVEGTQTMMSMVWNSTKVEIPIRFIEEDA